MVSRVLDVLIVLVLMALIVIAIAQFHSKAITYDINHFGSIVIDGTKYNCQED